MAAKINVLEKWNDAIKSVIARFVRGNIPAQLKRILLREEQKKNHVRAVSITKRWQARSG